MKTRSFYIPVSLIVITLLLSSAVSQADKLRYNDDGSVEFIDSSGKTRRVSMEGKTPYGQPVEEIKKVVRRRNFTIEVIYSSTLSDEAPGGAVKQFYQEIVKYLDNWVYKNRLPRGKMKLVVSNCRFCKTGYCRRKNKKEITLVIYKNNKKSKEISYPHEEILPKGASEDLAVKAVEALMK